MSQVTDEMIKAGTKFALNAKLGGEYRWPDYVRDLYLAMSSASPPVERSEGVERVARIIASKLYSPEDAEKYWCDWSEAAIAALKEGHSLSTVSGVVSK